MIDDALWTEIYSDEEIRIIEEHAIQDKDTLIAIKEILAGLEELEID